MQLIDTPELYSMLDETSSFMKALSSTENFTIFRAEAVQAIINYLYEPVKKWTLIYLFVPYCFFLASYVGYADFMVAAF